jgi:hypothetical protein
MCSKFLRFSRSFASVVAILYHVSLFVHAETIAVGRHTSPTDAKHDLGFTVKATGVKYAGSTAPVLAHLGNSRQLVIENMDADTRAGLAALLTIGIVLIGLGIAYFVFKRGRNPRNWGQRYAEEAKHQVEDIEALEAKKEAREQASSQSHTDKCQNRVLDEYPKRSQGDFSRSSRPKTQYSDRLQLQRHPRDTHSTGKESFGIDNDHDDYWDGVVDGFTRRQAERNQVLPMLICSGYMFAPKYCGNVSADRARSSCVIGQSRWIDTAITISKRQRLTWIRSRE